MTETVHLTLSSNYVPSWGMEEGCRELIQNWMDAGGQGIPTFEGGVLRLENDGVMDKKALLIGHTTKAGVAAARGEFGEGLKLGTLALLRDGCNVFISVPGERWTACLSEHPTLGERVLAWEIESSDSGSVCIEIHGLTSDDWGNIRKLFRFGADNTRDHVLQQKGLRGVVYVKNIYVTEDDSLEFGYDFCNLKTDRDRKMVNPYEMKSAAAAAFMQAVEDDEVSGDKALDMMLRQTGETERISKYGALVGFTQELESAWRKAHPDTAPAQNSDQVVALLPYDKKAKVVPDNLYSLLNVPKAKEVMEQVGSIHEKHEMSPSEQEMFDWMTTQVSLAGYSFYKLNVKIVNFSDVSVSSKYSPKDKKWARDGGTLLVSYRILTSKERLLVEVAKYAYVMDSQGFNTAEAQSQMLEKVLLNMGESQVDDDELDD